MKKSTNHSLCVRKYFAASYGKMWFVTPYLLIRDENGVQVRKARWNTPVWSRVTCFRPYYIGVKRTSPTPKTCTLFVRLAGVCNLEKKNTSAVTLTISSKLIFREKRDLHIFPFLVLFYMLNGRPSCFFYTGFKDICHENTWIYHISHTFFQPFFAGKKSKNQHPDMFGKLVGKILKNPTDSGQLAESV